MREKRRWLAASHALQAHFRALGICILRIADGLDNVHLTQTKWKPLYRRMMVQAAHFLGKDPGPMRLHLAALRQRTLIDARAETGYPTNKQGLQQHIRVIAHAPATHQDVLRRRIGHFVKTHGQSTLTRILECIADADAGELKEAFHDNHRAYLHNRVTLARHVMFRVLQRGGSQSDRGFLRSLVRSLKLRNLFLNGRFFLDTDHMWSPHLDLELGLCSPNMFHGPLRNSARTLSTWRGLCRAHLLQLLVANGHIGEQTLVEYLVTWGYPEQLVRFDLGVLRALGMLDSLDGDTDVELEVSIAGHKFLSYSFTHFDALYYFALDTPLPTAFVEQGLVCGHDNKVGRRTGYPRASISSGVVFLLFLSLMNELAQKRWQKVPAALRAKLAHLKHPLTLPFEEPQGLEQVLASLRQHIPTDRSEVDDIARGLAQVFALIQPPHH